MEVILFWNVVGDLEVYLRQPGGQEDLLTVKPMVRIRSMPLCRGLFEIFFGSNSPVPEARLQWVQGAKNLLDSENVKRNTRK